jgi:hypothetical protein
VLDEWFENEVKPRLKGNSTLVRFADDAVMAFADFQDAKRVLDVLGKRLARYELTLHPDKTRFVDFRNGFEVVIHQSTNHHLSKPVMIGKINSSGTFDVIWQSINPVRADAWSRYLPESAKRTADWTFPWVCGGCIEPTFKEW